MEQMSLFDGSKKFLVDKPIRLISLFSGYDSQEFALKYLGVEYEHWKTCEWAVKSIQALKDAHYENDNTDYSANHSQEFIIHQLFNCGISANYNEPMTKEQIKRLGEQKQRQIYNNVSATHNLVNIQQVTADRLEIIDRDKYCYLMTYSFPCQDLSKAGKCKGMAKDSGTRSGMLWEVERILDECNGNLPHILLMENVPDVIGSKNIEHFAKWLEKLESLGYKCYWKVLNSKDYGIPQNRERCFMISLLGDYYYEFPQTIKLEYMLKDLLEDSVDEKYYLSDKILSKINIENNNINEKIGVDLNSKISKTRDIANTIKARYDCGYENFTPGPTGVIEPSENILKKINIKQKVKVRRHNVEINKLKKLLKSHKTLSNKEISQRLNKPITLVEHWFRQDDSFAIPGEDIWFELKKLLSINTDYFDKQIIEFEIKDNVFESSNRAYIEDGISPTITTSASPNIIKNEINLKTKLCNELLLNGKVKENDVIRHSYSTSRMNNMYIQNNQFHDCSPTLDTRCDCLGVVVNDNVDLLVADGKVKKFKDSGISGTLLTNSNFGGIGVQLIKGEKTNYRIRKLTPKECFRLMGVKDEDFEKIAQNQSNASLYHLAGDSIVVNVLMAIFGKLFNKE